MSINSLYNLEKGKRYLFKYIHCESSIFNGLITRFTVDGYPWCESTSHRGIITDSYEIYNVDGSLIYNPVNCNKQKNILNFREFIKKIKCQN